MAPKPAAKGANNAEFRARRLSVSDLDTSEFEAAGGANSTPTQPAGAPRRRRHSLSQSPEIPGADDRKPPPVPHTAVGPPFSPTKVGTFSCHGREPSANGDPRGMAKINQDRGCMTKPFCNSDKVALFCVFDGHGQYGDKVSDFTMNKLTELMDMHKDLEALVEELNDEGKRKEMLTQAGSDKLQKRLDNCFKQSFLQTDAELKRTRLIDAELSGTTAVAVIVIQLSETVYHSWAAWTGDTRAIMGKKQGESIVAQDMTDDHKPDRPDELQRIHEDAPGNRRGYISPPEVAWGGPARVWIDKEMTMPGLAMSRSIGDHLVTEVGVIAEPEIQSYRLDMGAADAPEFLVLASDGVWEFIDSETAVQICLEAGVKSDATAAAKKLIKESTDAWRKEEGDYCDDITAIIVNLPGLFA